MCFALWVGFFGGVEGGGGCCKTVLNSILCFHPVWKWEELFTLLVYRDYIIKILGVLIDTEMCMQCLRYYILKFA